MTTTMLRPGTTWTPTAPTPTTEALRDVLDDALDVAADDAADEAADRYSSRTPAGRTLLSLAAVARRAAGAVGAEPGVALTDGPGVVVQRELAAAARLLDEAAEAADGEPWGMEDLLVQARRLHAQLLVAMTASPR
jgi:hypothetical protein